MTLIDFPEANSNFGPPPGFDESQVKSAMAYIGQVERGPVEGVSIVVVAWKPTSEELDELNAGAPIFLSVLGGLPPHYLTVDFYSATHPS